MGVQQKPIGFLNFKRLLKAQFLKNGLGLERWGRGEQEKYFGKKEQMELLSL